MHVICRTLKHVFRPYLNMYGKIVKDIAPAHPPPPPSNFQEEGVQLKTLDMKMSHLPPPIERFNKFEFEEKITGYEFITADALSELW